MVPIKCAQFLIRRQRNGPQFAGRLNVLNNGRRNIFYRRKIPQALEGFEQHQQPESELRPTCKLQSKTEFLIRRRVQRIEFLGQWTPLESRVGGAFD